MFAPCIILNDILFKIDLALDKKSPSIVISNKQYKYLCKNASKSMTFISVNLDLVPMKYHF